MGCWNKTCGITQFPLVAGDKTVNFILIQTEYKVDATPCYANGHGWDLLPLPFYGSYDDYGWQDDEEGQQPKYDFLAKYFEGRIVLNETQERMDKYHPNIKSPFESSQALDMSIHRNLWVIGNPLRDMFPNTKNKMLASFTISRIVWDAFTKEILQTYPERKTHTRADIAAHIAAYVTHYNNQRATLSELEFKYYRLAGVDDYISNVYGGATYGNPLVDAVRWAANARTYDNSCGEFNPIEPLLSGAITAEDVAVMYLLTVAMNFLRKTFQPQSYCGSQEGIGQYHSDLIKVMQDMIEHDKTRWD